MNDLSDQQLLRQYADQQQETAFAELVRRHVDLVYSAALRLVRDAHLAEDVTQNVFVALASNAGQLAAHPVLSGWLHCSTRNLAAKTIRTETRRRAREQEAATMNELPADAGDAWKTIAPHLDAALGDLPASDRDALLLRYFEKKSASEMARILGISDAAAQKRVNRAVDRLRDLFAKRGVTVGAGGLGVVIATNAVQAAPVGLAPGISSIVLAGAVSTSTLIAATQTIVMTTVQKTLIGLALAVAVGTSLYQTHQAARLRGQIQTLEQQQSLQTSRLQIDRDDATNRLAAMQANQVRSDSHQDELLKLRGEVGQMRQALQNVPAARAALLKQKLAAMPDKQIPELVFLTEKDWLNAAWNADLDSDDGVRLALSKLRDESVDTFFHHTQKALKKYLAANDNLLPADLLPLKPYYEATVTDDMLQRYTFTQTGKIGGNSPGSVVQKAVYADADYDSNQWMGLGGGGGGSFNRVHDAIYQAVTDYSMDHNGQMPEDSSQISTYLKRSVDPATIQKYFGQIKADAAENPPPPESVALIPLVQAYRTANSGKIPKLPSDLQPYATTPEQSAALQKVIQDNQSHQ